MSYSDTNWRSATAGRFSLFSTPGNEEPSFSSTSSQVSNAHLHKTLNKLVDRFDIIHEDSSSQENQRQKDRLLDSYANEILR
jgi:hypothetical protein